MCSHARCAAGHPEPLRPSTASVPISFSTWIAPAPARRESRGCPCTALGDVPRLRGRRRVCRHGSTHATTRGHVRKDSQSLKGGEEALPLLRKRRRESSTLTADEWRAGFPRSPRRVVGSISVVVPLQGWWTTARRTAGGLRGTCEHGRRREWFRGGLRSPPRLATDRGH